MPSTVRHVSMTIVCYPEEEREAVADAVDEEEEGEEGTEATTEHGRSDVHHRLLGALCGEHLVGYHYMSCTCNEVRRSHVHLKYTQ